MTRALGRLRSPRRQRGATAIEFAILFPMFFLILYGIITYGMIFAAQQSLTLAATEGARAALNYQVAQTQSAALGLRAAAACTAANNLTGWLSGATCTTSTNYTLVRFDDVLHPGDAHVSVRGQPARAGGGAVRCGAADHAHEPRDGADQPDQHHMKYPSD